eukprot:m.363672 g.363672  ORF g.363672 m.363672 type:complete len:225 (+) comp56029_c0_seq4:2370-3044(+)
MEGSEFEIFDDLTLEELETLLNQSNGTTFDASQPDHDASWPQPSRATDLQHTVAPVDDLNEDSPPPLLTTLDYFPLTSSAGLEHFSSVDDFDFSADQFTPLGSPDLDPTQNESGHSSASPVSTTGSAPAPQRRTGVDRSSKKKIDARWDASLFELDTRQLNAFILENNLTKAEGASLKQARRRAKNRGYSKKSSDQKRLAELVAHLNPNPAQIKQTGSSGRNHF